MTFGPIHRFYLWHHSEYDWLDFQMLISSLVLSRSENCFTAAYMMALKPFLRVFPGIGASWSLWAISITSRTSVLDFRIWAWISFMACYRLLSPTWPILGNRTYYRTDVRDHVRKTTRRMFWFNSWTRSLYVPASAMVSPIPIEWPSIITHWLTIRLEWFSLKYTNSQFILLVVTELMKTLPDSQRKTFWSHQNLFRWIKYELVNQQRHQPFSYRRFLK